MRSIFHGGQIYTVDVSTPWAQAFTVEDGRITAVGTDADMLELADGDTTTIDLDGAFVMPGLVDIHNHHFVSGREELFELTIPLGADVDAIIEAVAAHIDSGKLA